MWVGPFHKGWCPRPIKNRRWAQTSIAFCFLRRDAMWLALTNSCGPDLSAMMDYAHQLWARIKPPSFTCFYKISCHSNKESHWYRPPLLLPFTEPLSVTLLPGHGSLSAGTLHIQEQDACVSSHKHTCTVREGKHKNINRTVGESVIIYAFLLPL